jgi:phenylacetate-CoA ligase
MIEAGIKPEDVKSLEDLKRLPFTNKKDLRDNYPFGLFTVPKKDLVRIHASSGTTGKPTVVGYTEKDLRTWTECVSRIAAMGGATQEDVAQICFGYGMFTGALGLHYGLENLGATVCPTSSGNTQKQIMYMQDFETSLLVATPSYALHIGEVVRQMGLDPEKDLKVRIGLFGGEGMTEPMREEMYKLWGHTMKVTQNYGMSELIGPGVSGECLELCGMHINEDHFIPEIIDTDTGEVLPPGSKGELVITCITKEALPLIRYRTKDISRLMYEPCKCGRTTVRMENLSGRSDDMLIIRGVNVFPSQIEEVLLKVPEIGAHYEIVVDRKKHLDYMEIKVELADESLLDSYAKLGELEQKIKTSLRVVLGLDAMIKLVAPRSLQRFEGKAKRVTDLRKDL